MAKFDDILIISDIDQTLLSDDKSINIKNIQAVDYFIKNGGRFTLASGRSCNSILPILKEIKINAPCICINGAVVYDYLEDKILFESHINHIHAIEIVSDIMEKFKSVGVEVFTKSGLFMVRANDYTKIHIKRESRHYTAENIKDARLPWYKVLICDHPQVLMRVSDYVNKYKILEKCDSCRFVFSESIFYELMSKDISKGGALEVLQNNLGYKFNKVYALGDNYNDIEMIKAANVGVGVKNAVPELKKAADFIVCDNNDGAVYDLIRHIENKKI